MTEDTKGQVKKIKIKGLTEAKIKAIERAWTDDAGFGSIGLTVKEAKKYEPPVTAAVSYTHLTLPTILLV